MLCYHYEDILFDNVIDVKSQLGVAESEEAALICLLNEGKILRVDLLKITSHKFCWFKSAGLASYRKFLSIPLGEILF